VIEQDRVAGVRSTRGAFAVLITAYHLLARHTAYQDPGSDDCYRHHAGRARRRVIRTLERQGFRVALGPAV